MRGGSSCRVWVLEMDLIMLFHAGFCCINETFTAHVNRCAVVRFFWQNRKEILCAVADCSACLFCNESDGVGLKDQPEFSFGFSPPGCRVAVDSAVCQNLVEIGDKRSGISEFPALLLTEADEIVVPRKPFVPDATASEERSFGYSDILFQEHKDAV